MRRIMRDTGVFFCFVFCHVAENEETLSEKHPGSVKPLRGRYQGRRIAALNHFRNAVHA